MQVSGEMVSLIANEQRSFDLLPLGLCVVDRASPFAAGIARSRNGPESAGRRFSTVRAAKCSSTWPPFRFASESKGCSAAREKTNGCVRCMGAWLRRFERRPWGDAANDRPPVGRRGRAGTRHCRRRDERISTNPESAGRCKSLRGAMRQLQEQAVELQRQRRSKSNNRGTTLRGRPPSFPTRHRNSKSPAAEPNKRTRRKRSFWPT